MKAAELGHVELAKRLVQAGANKYGKDDDGQTAISMTLMSCRYRDEDAKRTMLDILVDVSDPNTPTNVRCPSLGLLEGRCSACMQVS